MANQAFADWNHRATMHVEENSTAETTVDTTPRIVTAPTFVANGSSGLTIDAANNKITTANDGVTREYLVTCTTSFSGATGKIIHMVLYVDGVATYLELSRDMSSSDIGSAAFNGLLSIAPNKDINVWQYADSATVLTIHDLQLTLTRQG